MSTPKRTCSIKGCDRPHESRGWCNMHYKRWRKHGDLFRGLPSTVDRFWAKVDSRDGDECWPWVAKARKGYGQFPLDGRFIRAHRFAYELAVGPIPEGYQIHHVCGNRLCCKPGHLKAVTATQHVEHHLGRSLTEPLCMRHPPEAERRQPSGRRYCAMCSCERWAAWRARQSVRTQ